MDRPKRRGVKVKAEIVEDGLGDVKSAVTKSRGRQKKRKSDAEAVAPQSEEARTETTSLKERKKKGVKTSHTGEDLQTTGTPVNTGNTPEVTSTGKPRRTSHRQKKEKKSTGDGQNVTEGKENEVPEKGENLQRQKKGKKSTRDSQGATEGKKSEGKSGQSDDTNSNPKKTGKGKKTTWKGGKESVSNKDPDDEESHVLIQESTTDVSKVLVKQEHSDGATNDPKKKAKTKKTTKKKGKGSIDAKHLDSESQTLVQESEPEASNDIILEKGKKIGDETREKPKRKTKELIQKLQTKDSQIGDTLGSTIDPAPRAVIPGGNLVNNISSTEGTTIALIHSENIGMLSDAAGSSKKDKSTEKTADSENTTAHSPTKVHTVGETIDNDSTADKSPSIVSETVKTADTASSDEKFADTAYSISGNSASVLLTGDKIGDTDVINDKSTDTVSATNERSSPVSTDIRISDAVLSSRKSADSALTNGKTADSAILQSAKVSEGKDIDYINYTHNQVNVSYVIDTPTKVSLPGDEKAADSTFTVEDSEDNTSTSTEKTTDTASTESTTANVKERLPEKGGLASEILHKELSNRDVGKGDGVESIRQDNRKRKHVEEDPSVLQQLHPTNEELEVRIKNIEAQNSKMLQIVEEKSKHVDALQEEMSFIKAKHVMEKEMMIQLLAKNVEVYEAVSKASQKTTPQPNHHPDTGSNGSHEVEVSILLDHCQQQKKTVRALYQQIDEYNLQSREMCAKFKKVLVYLLTNKRDVLLDPSKKTFVNTILNDMERLQRVSCEELCSFILKEEAKELSDTLQTPACNNNSESSVIRGGDDVDYIKASTPKVQTNTTAMGHCVNTHNKENGDSVNVFDLSLSGGEEEGVSTDKAKDKCGKNNTERVIHGNTMCNIKTEDTRLDSEYGNIIQGKEYLQNRPSNAAKMVRFQEEQFLVQERSHPSMTEVNTTM